MEDDPMRKSALLVVMVYLFVFSLAALAGVKTSPTSIAGAETIDATKAKSLFDKGVLFVDVRSNKDWEAGRIPDAVHLELHSNFTEASLSAVVPKDQEVVFYCNGEHCMRSSEATEQAVGWGWQKVYYFRDGFPAWKGAGYPAE
jgi:rhodanese-related sulfurtransferase